MIDPTRRDLLRSALGAVALAPASAAGGAPLTDAGETPIPEPFDAVPTLEEPPERLRSIAGVVFPPEAVPEEGPIPDVHHSHTEAVEITVPPWAFEAVRWRLSHAEPGTVDRWKVREFLAEYAHADEQFRTPDGRDAVDALLEEVDDADV